MGPDSVLTRRTLLSGGALFSLRVLSRLIAGLRDILGRAVTVRLAVLAIGGFRTAGVAAGNDRARGS